MHCHRLVVTPAQHGKKALQVLKEGLPSAPQFQLRASLLKRDIRVDGDRIREDVRVSQGSTIAWYTPWAPDALPVVYEDAHVLVVNKPAGISSDEQSPGQQSIINWARDHVGENSSPVLVHRLDQMTSGLLLIAKDSEWETMLGNALRERTLIKRYQCVVGGRPSQHALMEAYLHKDARRGEVRILERAAHGAKPIRTEYHLLGMEKLGARLLVTLHTGRTHQIRAHLTHAGLPILGDDKYGDRELNKAKRVRRLMLAATSIAFPVGDAWGALSGRELSIPPPF